MSFCSCPIKARLRRTGGVLAVTLLSNIAPLAMAADACVHDATLVFTESAPRDRFEIRNDSSSGQRIQRLTLDLADSAGRLIFDTVAGGTGVEVFQPFRVESGTAKLSETPEVPDGSDRVTLNFARFEPGQTFQFSIDVDDRLSASELGQIRITGGEMQGALLKLTIGAPDGAAHEVQARVDSKNQARVQAACD